MNLPRNSLRMPRRVRNRASRMETKMIIGCGGISVRLLRKGMKTASMLGCKTLTLLIRSIRSQVVRPLCAMTFS